MVVNHDELTMFASLWYTKLGRGVKSAVFFFNHTATTDIYTLSLHDALPISVSGGGGIYALKGLTVSNSTFSGNSADYGDRKSTRLNSSHLVISYAVFCL